MNGLSLDELSCPQIWKIEQEKDIGKEEVGGRPAKLNEKKSDGDLEREIKNKGDIYLLEEQITTMNNSAQGPVSSKSR